MQTALATGFSKIESARHPSYLKTLRTHNTHTILPASLLLALLRRRNLLARTVPRGIRIRPLDDDAVPRTIAHAETVLPLDVATLPHLPDRLLRVRGPLVLEAGEPPVVPVVVFKGVGFLAVDGVVADFAHLVRHAEGDAADVFDEAHDERGPDDVPADDEEGADDLQADLAAVAGDGPAGVRESEGGAAFLGCPESWTMRVSTRSGEGCRRLTYRCRRRRQWRLRSACGRRLGYHRLCA